MCIPVPIFTYLCHMTYMQFKCVVETTQGGCATNKCENYFTADGQEQSDYHKKQSLLPVSYLVYLGFHYKTQSSDQ